MGRKYKVNKVVEHLQDDIDKAAEEIISRIEDDHPEVAEHLRKIQCHIVDQSRGRAYYFKRVTTVPIWAYSPEYHKKNHTYPKGAKDEGFFEYYLSHELAHHATNLKHPGVSVAPHGKEFMSWFKRLCPRSLWHHELGYKPRNAAAAGITEKKENKQEKTEKKEMNERVRIADADKKDQKALLTSVSKREQGNSFGDIAKELNRRGMRTSTGKQWRAQTVRYLLVKYGYHS